MREDHIDLYAYSPPRTPTDYSFVSINYKYFGLPDTTFGNPQDAIFAGPDIMIHAPGNRKDRSIIRISL